MAEETKKFEIRSMRELKEVFSKHLLLADENVLQFLVANVIANQFKGFPNWGFLVGASSGGKSELIQAFNNITFHGRPMVFPISDLTVNAFASGQKKVGKETSLLHQIPPGGMLSFKDFTSMVSKAKEARGEIFKQLREIFDGSYVKRTGTGDNVDWRGKIGAIAGATEIIYEYQQEFATMGDRFIMYCLIQPDRKKLLEFVLDDTRVNSDKQLMQQELSDAVQSYVEYLFQNMGEEENIILDQGVKNDLANVADFCTRVRSGVKTDERRPDKIEFVPAIEMPVRMIHQLVNIAKAFLVMKRLEPGIKNEDLALNDNDRNILYKLAFDSIPIKRRMALKALAKYEGGVRTKGLATAINYQTPVVNSWLAQLNALGICTRTHKGGNQGDIWYLKDEYRGIMVKFEKVEVVNEMLDDDSDEEDDMASLDSHLDDTAKARQISLDPQYDADAEFEKF